MSYSLKGVDAEYRQLFNECQFALQQCRRKDDYVVPMILADKALERARKLERPDLNGKVLVLKAHCVMGRGSCREAKAMYQQAQAMQRQFMQPESLQLFIEGTPPKRCLRTLGKVRNVELQQDMDNEVDKVELKSTEEMVPESLIATVMSSPPQRPASPKASPSPAKIIETVAKLRRDIRTAVQEKPKLWQVEEAHLYKYDPAQYIQALMADNPEHQGTFGSESTPWVYAPAVEATPDPMPGGAFGEESERWEDDELDKALQLPPSMTQSNPDISSRRMASPPPRPKSPPSSIPGFGGSQRLVVPRFNASRPLARAQRDGISVEDVDGLTLARPPQPEMDVMFAGMEAVYRTQRLRELEGEEKGQQPGEEHNGTENRQSEADEDQQEEEDNDDDAEGDLTEDMVRMMEPGSRQQSRSDSSDAASSPFESDVEDNEDDEEQEELSLDTDFRSQQQLHLPSLLSSIEEEPPSATFRSEARKGIVCGHEAAMPGPRLGSPVRSPPPMSPPKRMVVLPSFETRQPLLAPPSPVQQTKAAKAKSLESVAKNDPVAHAEAIESVIKAHLPLGCLTYNALVNIWLSLESVTLFTVSRDDDAIGKAFHKFLKEKDELLKTIIKVHNQVDETRQFLNRWLPKARQYGFSKANELRIILIFAGIVYKCRWKTEAFQNMDDARQYLRDGIQADRREVKDTRLRQILGAPAEVDETPFRTWQDANLMQMAEHLLELMDEWCATRPEEKPACGCLYGHRQCTDHHSTEGCGCRTVGLMELCESHLKEFGEKPVEIMPPGSARA